MLPLKELATVTLPPVVSTPNTTQGKPAPLAETKLPMSLPDQPLPPA